MKTNVLFEKCPNGCRVNLSDSNIVVSEGPLKSCPECGQLVSSCSVDYYEKSNQDWNAEEGTWPSKKDFARLLKRRKRDINYIRKLLLKDYSDIHILDIGCSNGSSLLINKKLGLKAVGVDPSEKAVQNGRERGFEIHLGFLNDVGFADNSFDVITLYEVIEHVDTPIALLKECHRILRPNGIVLIGSGNTNSWTRQIQKSRWDFFNMKLHGGHINFYSTKSIKTLASATGFSVTKTRTSSVKFCEKGEISFALYRVLKIFSELLNIPARIFNKGHQMEAYLVSNKRQ